MDDKLKKNNEAFNNLNVLYSNTLAEINNMNIDNNKKNTSNIM
jgi:hypothetical protein